MRESEYCDIGKGRERELGGIEIFAASNLDSWGARFTDPSVH
jgi:hypothetical protein